jgi:hypothetical protein
MEHETKKDFEIANLTLEELKKIENLENELGITLIAYDNTKRQS